MKTTSIYKYFEPDRFDVLSSGQITYTPPNRFNDPFDMNPAVDSDVSDECLDMECAQFEKDFPLEAKEPSVLSEVRSRYKTLMIDGKSSFDQEMNRGLIELINRHYGVFCCTELAYDVIMWSHYAKQHEGFVIEFDLTHSFFDERMCAVNYNPARPRISSSEEMETKMEKLVLAKSDKWFPEKEWRSIELLANCMPKAIKKDAEETTIYLYAYPKDSVRRIICGCRMSRPNKEILRTQLLSWGFTGCILEELSLHPHHYEFESRLVELIAGIDG